MDEYVRWGIYYARVAQREQLAALRARERGGGRA